MEQSKRGRRKNESMPEKIKKLNEREAAVKKEIAKLQKELKEIPIKRNSIENQIAGELLRGHNMSIDELQAYIKRMKVEFWQSLKNDEEMAAVAGNGNNTDGNGGQPAPIEMEGSGNEEIDEDESM